MEQSERPIGAFRSFNDFFTRTLKPGMRPLANAATDVLSPADGAVSQLGQIENGRIFQAKGQNYTAAELLGGDTDLAKRFEGGSFITIYLSPSDYHRVHMPVGGALRQTAYIPGDLFSVNTVTAQNVPRLFSRNERLSCVFDTTAGTMASVMVGAMIVASIKTAWGGLIQPHGKRVIRTDLAASDTAIADLSAGDEMGQFLLGSTVILLFEPGRVEWSPALEALSVVRMGQSLGKFCTTS